MEIFKNFQKKVFKKSFQKYPKLVRFEEQNSIENSCFGGRGIRDPFLPLIVSDRRECKLPETFYRMKKYCSWPKLSHFKILKMQLITVCA